MNPVLSALWFLQTHSLANLVRVRLQRLRKPRYLIGAVVGLGYLWMVVLRPMFMGAVVGPGGPVAGVEARDTLLMQTLWSVGLALYVVSSWLFTGDRASLTFTEAEVAFLMPAPASRRALLHYRLLRSQPGVLMSAFFLNLLSGRADGFLPWLFHGFTFWLVFTLLSLHALGASFAIQRLTERGLSGWRRRVAVLTVAATLAGIVIVWILGAPAAQPVRDFNSLRDAALVVASSGPGPWLLAPFRWVIAPWFAPDLAAFLAAAGPALGVLAAHYLWVLRADVAFEEASIQASRVLAERLAAARAGNAVGLRPPKVRKDPFHLAPAGFPPMALLWKNLVAAGPLFRPRTLLVALAGILVLGVLSVAMGRAIPRLQSILAILAFTSVLLLMMSVFLGPQMVRHDFRTDIPRLDILKSLPLPAWQVVLGQLLAPLLILVAGQWLLVGVALAASLGLPADVEDPLAIHRWPISLALALVLPAVDVLLLLFPNAVALLFPAWIGSVGFGRAPGGGGIEVMGQRLLFGIGMVVVLLAGLIPGGIVGGIAWWLLQWITGPIWALPPAALVVAAVLAAEGAAGIWVLARAFDGLDVADA